MIFILNIIKESFETMIKSVKKVIPDIFGEENKNKSNLILVTDSIEATIDEYYNIFF